MVANAIDDAKLQIDLARRREAYASSEIRNEYFTAESGACRSYVADVAIKKNGIQCNTGPTGTASGGEILVSNFARSVGFPTTRQVDLQFGVVDSIGNHGYGYVANSNLGNNDTAFLAQESRGQWAFFFS